MSVLFADTAFWIALTNRRDQYHERAVAWRRHVAASRIRLVTTEAVLWEWLNGMSHPSSRQIVAQGYRRCHHDPSISVVTFDAETVGAALSLYEERPDKSWSLTDCISFVVMEREEIHEALTTDHHFEQAGYSTLLKSEPPNSSDDT